MELYRHVQMLSKYQINQSYSKWFEALITDYIDPKQSAGGYTNQYLAENGFFITLVFDRNRVAARKQSDAFQNRGRNSVEFYNFDHFYNIVCRRLLGRDFMKPKFQSSRPLVIACADAQGSRTWRSMGEIENVHLHTIWVLKPHLSSMLETVITDVEGSREGNLFDFCKIDIRRIDRFDERDRASARLTSYASKFLAFNSMDADMSEDIMIYPRRIH